MGINLKQIERFFFIKSVFTTLHTFFFDGRHVQQVFRDNVLKSYFKGKLDSAINTNEIKSSNTYLKIVTNIFKLYLKEDLPGYALECKLPKDILRSRFFSNQGYVFMLFCLIYLGIIALRSLLMAVTENSLKYFILAIYFQSLFLLFYPICRRLTYPLMSIKQGIRFLVVITRVNPGQSLDEWNKIAKYMNYYLANEGNFKQSSVEFFDGEHCLSFFKSYFEPLSVGNDCLEYADLKEIVKIIQPYVN